MYPLLGTMLIKFAVFAVLAVPLSPAPCNQASAPAQYADPFAAWMGTWKGAGWALADDGQRFDFEVVERVECRVGGAVLLMVGKATRTAAPGQPVVIHDGVALVWFDDERQEYRWQSHEIGRRPVDTSLRLIDGGVEWTIKEEGQAAAVRFTIRVDHDGWHEVGEVTADGQTWSKIMECTLQKTNDDVEVFP
jgi:hypothetical protein